MTMTGEYDVPSNFIEGVALLRSLISKRKLLKDTLESPSVSAALKLIGQQQPG